MRLQTVESVRRGNRLYVRLSEGDSQVQKALWVVCVCMCVRKDTPVNTEFSLNLLGSVTEAELIILYL